MSQANSFTLAIQGSAHAADRDTDVSLVVDSILVLTPGRVTFADLATAARFRIEPALPGELFGDRLPSRVLAGCSACHSGHHRGAAARKRSLAGFDRLSTQPKKAQLSSGQNMSDQGMEVLIPSGSFGG